MEGQLRGFGGHGIALNRHPMGWDGIGMGIGMGMGTGRSHLRLSPDHPVSRLQGVGREAQGHRAEASFLPRSALKWSRVVMLASPQLWLSLSRPTMAVSVTPALATAIPGTLRRAPSLLLEFPRWTLPLSSIKSV